MPEGAAIWRMPSFMGDEYIGQLLAHVAANEHDFTRTVTAGGRAPGIRQSENMLDLGAFREPIEKKVLAHLPQVCSELGIGRFDVSSVETELVAHRDGAFYKRHIDLLFGRFRQDSAEDRVVTFVWYFFPEPRRFEGGTLRLYPDAGMVAPECETHVDMIPQNDVAIAFSSWMPHEVVPVTVSSREFRDSRFAVNCWVRRAAARGS